MSLLPRTHRRHPGGDPGPDPGPDPGRQPDEVEAARRLVSGAEARALDRAEELRAEAEQILKQVAARAAESERQIEARFAADLSALRAELGEASRRATAAEAELEVLRAGPVGAGLGEEAQLELTRAKEAAMQALTRATSEAEDLPARSVAAIQEDITLAEASREQAQADAEAAAALRRQAEVGLGQVSEESARIREEAQRQAAQRVEEAESQAARLLDEAQVAASRILEEARSAATEILDEARLRAERVTEEADRAAAERMAAERRQLAAELAGLRDAVDRTRHSFDLLVQPPQPPQAPHPPQPPGSEEGLR